MKHEFLSHQSTHNHASLKPQQPFFGPKKQDSFFKTRPAQPVQMKTANTAAAAAGTAGPGSAAKDVRTTMGNAFGTDFSAVQVHENSSSATAIGAHAYTQGNDVHFAPGQFNPSSAAGQQLIGHEFTHVLQQRAGIVRPGVQAKGMAINKDTELEQAADRNGARIAEGSRPSAADIGAAPAAGNTGTAVIQGYFAHNDSTGTPYRVADDVSVATKDNNPWHELYAEAGKADVSNAALKATGSKIVLSETGAEKEFDVAGGVKKKLKRVSAKNLVDKTEGDAMKLYADCGYANSVVVGGFNRAAVYKDNTGNAAVAADSDPEMMKYKIIADHFGSQIPNAATALTTMGTYMAALQKSGEAIKPYNKDIEKNNAKLPPLLNKLNDAQKALDDFNKKYNAATPAEKAKLDPTGNTLVAALKTASDAYSKGVKDFWDSLAAIKDAGSGKTVKELLEKYIKDKDAHDKLEAQIMKPYYSLSSSNKDKFDQKAGINAYANPSVGHGYTASSGGTPYAGKSTWNYHWGGVIMESNDTKDKVVLENYATGNNNADHVAGNDQWDFKIYGVGKKGQSFHEQHKATKQHGDTPVTMEVKKQ